MWRIPDEIWIIFSLLNKLLFILFGVEILSGIFDFLKFDLSSDNCPWELEPHENIKLFFLSKKITCFSPHWISSIWILLLLFLKNSTIVGFLTSSKLLSWQHWPFMFLYFKKKD